MPFQPRIPDGQHLGDSRDVDGAFVGHLFDNNTNKLVGHAVWEWVDEPDNSYGRSTNETERELTPEEIAQAIEMVIVIVAGVAKLIIIAQPHVNRWWSERVIPYGRRVRERATRWARKKPAPKTRPMEQSQLIYVATRSGVDVVDDRDELRMSSREWASRFQLMLAASAVKDDQMRVLSRAVVDDSERGIGSFDSDNEVTPRQFADHVMRALVRNPGLVNDETAAELARAFSKVPESAKELRQMGRGAS